MSGTASAASARAGRPTALSTRRARTAAVSPALCSAHCSRSLDSSHSLAEPARPSSQVAVHLLRPVGRVAEHTPHSPPGCGAPSCRTRSAYSVAVCGLLGLLTSGADADTPRGTRRGGALRCARHRGPDESGTWHDADVVFGFNRLSIIDVEHSHQPLRWGPSGADGRYTIVFNGEIYNYLELRDELAREHGRDVRHRGRHRGDRRRLPPLGPGRGGPAARDVRLPDLGRPGAGAVRRARPVRHQAAVLGRRAAAGWRSRARRRACWS